MRVQVKAVEISPDDVQALTSMYEASSAVDPAPPNAVTEGDDARLYDSRVAARKML